MGGSLQYWIPEAGTVITFISHGDILSLPRTAGDRITWLAAKTISPPWRLRRGEMVSCLSGPIWSHLHENEAVVLACLISRFTGIRHLPPVYTGLKKSVLDATLEGCAFRHHWGAPSWQWDYEAMESALSRIDTMLLWHTICNRRSNYKHEYT